jgi:hypothetical protein
MNADRDLERVVADPAELDEFLEAMTRRCLERLARREPVRVLLLVVPGGGAQPLEGPSR